jgi:short-subunit dehydrogenase
MSKAALNQFTKTLSIELKRTSTIVMALHPGTTDTTLSKPFQKNVKEGKLFTPEYSVSMMLDVVMDELDAVTAKIKELLHLMYLRVLLKIFTILYLALAQ